MLLLSRFAALRVSRGSLLCGAREWEEICQQAGPTRTYQGDPFEGTPPRLLQKCLWHTRDMYPTYPWQIAKITWANRVNAYSSLHPAAVPYSPVVCYSFGFPRTLVLEAIDHELNRPFTRRLEIPALHGSMFTISSGALDEYSIGLRALTDEEQQAVEFGEPTTHVNIMLESRRTVSLYPLGRV